MDLSAIGIESAGVSSSAESALQSDLEGAFERSLQNQIAATETAITGGFGGSSTSALPSNESEGLLLADASAQQEQEIILSAPELKSLIDSGDLKQAGPIIDSSPSQVDYALPSGETVRITFGDQFEVSGSAEAINELQGLLNK